ncbi:MAG: caspase family protein [Pseudomonadota bacterium]
MQRSRRTGSGSLYLGILILLVCAPEGAQAARRALVIGNAEYTHQQASLNNPVNDAKLIKGKLEAAGFAVRYEENLTRAEFGHAITSFTEEDLGRDDVAVVYYAGHGMEINGANYLLGVDFQAGNEIDGEAEGYNLERLFKHLDASPAAAHIVIIDACRDDPFSKGWSKSRSLRGRGFVPVSNVPRGWYIVFSTGTGEIADDGSGGNSPFTKALAKHILTPGLDLSELFKKVRKTLADMGSEQVPETRETLTGMFYFVPGSGPPPPPEPVERLDSCTLPSLRCGDDGNSNREVLNGKDRDIRQEGVWQMVRNGDHMMAICLGHKELGRVANFSALQRGRIYYDMGRAWMGIGCQAQACSWLESSLNTRPHSGRGFEITCETCSKYGCTSCPGCY